MLIGNALIGRREAASVAAARPATTHTRRVRALVALAGLTGATALAGCTQQARTGDAITVTATDTECTVSAAEAPAGVVRFTVTNQGSKVNEFYVYAEGDQIMGEAENISPGQTREFRVDLPDPGRFETACKPGMVGDGIRAPFTVTGEKVERSQDEKTKAATDSYARYVRSQSTALVERTGEFTAAVKAGDVKKAKALYPVARSYFERIEPVAESFGDLDPKIDGREDVIEEGMKFTGYHRLEKDLWKDGLDAQSSQVADQLLKDVTELATRAKKVEYDALDLANGSKALLDEMATGKITGEEERYSHTDLYDFAANYEGSKTAIAALRPVVKEKDADLVADIDARQKKLDEVLDTHRRGDGWVLYTDLSEAEVKELSTALDAYSEVVAEVAGVVAP